MSSASRVIFFLGYTCAGSRQDYAILKDEFPPELPWFEALKGLLDLGYLGIQKDYRAKQFSLPHRKPRTSKARPNPQLTVTQKEDNRALAKLRVLVEHAIGGMKRYHILVAPYRNHRPYFEDDVAVIAAGLWNFLIT